MSERGITEARADGWDDAFGGYPREANPYEADPSYAKAWDDGWVEYASLNFPERLTHIDAGLDA